MMHRPEETSAVRNPMIGIPGQIIRRKTSSRHPTTKLEESQVFEDKDHQTKGQDMPNQDTKPKNTTVRKIFEAASALFHRTRRSKSACTMRSAERRPT